MPTIRLAARPESVHLVRRFVADALAGLCGEDTVATVVLLVSEVVTNAIVHGGPHDAVAEVVARVEHGDAVVRVEVYDHNRDNPVVVEADAGNEFRAAGRGMAFVDELSDAWGVSADGRGKWVWFEVRSA